MRLDRLSHLHLRTVLLALAMAPLLAACISSGERDFKVEPPASLTTQVAPTLTLEFSSGDIRVLPSADEKLRATATFYCDQSNSQCLKNAAKASIVHQQRAEHSTIRFEPGSAYTTRHANVIYRVEVPMVDSLKVSFDAGDVRVDSPTACLKASGAAGDLNITAPYESVASVSLDANLGDANLITPAGLASDRRPLLVGSEVEWAEGPGNCAMNAKLTAGAISVRLEDDSTQ
ncbi:MAG: hypothetical protein Cons2KO_14350 [Congregibacter sp.]